MQVVSTLKKLNLQVQSILREYNKLLSHLKAIDRLILLHTLILTYRNNRKLPKQLVFTKYRPRNKLIKNTKKRLMNIVRLLEAAMLTVMLLITATKQDLVLTSLEVLRMIVDIIMTNEDLDLHIKVVQPDNQDSTNHIRHTSRSVHLTNLTLGDPVLHLAHLAQLVHVLHTTIPIHLAAPNLILLELVKPVTTISVSLTILTVFKLTASSTKNIRLTLSTLSTSSMTQAVPPRRPQVVLITIALLCRLLPLSLTLSHKNTQSTTN